MEKMKYNISARTTILIGREGVSRADGAIIELVKNTYDADADFCYIGFDVEHDKIYILDNGSGMTKSIIESAWMLIGTDNKKNNILSEKKRVKSGEKGIGRFALDRLGSKCTMYTKNKCEELIYWFNDWNRFEEEGKTLDEIEADFMYLKGSLSDYIPGIIKEKLNAIENSKKKERFNANKSIPSFSLETGTMFIIEGLRDKWNSQEIEKIFSVLGFLVPPGEQTQYYIFAQKDFSKEIEEIVSEIIEDYDYKVVASFDGSNVSATIYRNEFDINAMPKDLFNLKAFQNEPYNIDTFTKGYFTKNVALSDLIKNCNKDFLDKAKEVGPFSFQYIFMKLGGGEGNYYSKPVNSKRKIWMEEHGGIKIYRDNFVVRPYGDPQSKSFDWLGLDARKGGNPVAVTHRSEQWHVNNSQIQGTVIISRKENYSILDKSNREGIIENDCFEVLSNILISMISIFERDRAYIAHNIREYKAIKDSNSSTKKQASEIASKVLKNSRKRKNSEDRNGSDAEYLAKAIKLYEEEIEEHNTEIKLLRALSTNGLMTTAMVHDLKTINSLLVTRVNTMKIAIKNNDSPQIIRNLQDLKTNDEFLKSWITVITSQSIRDRRKRLNKDIIKTIKTSISRLDPILKRKKVNLILDTDNNVALKRIFEIDFDSIMYNLIINSIESFEETECVDREIRISMKVDNNTLIINYEDNGHGLNKAFLTNPYEIFNYGITSKVDANGNQIGTGLGMYIVASSINEYNGKYSITKIVEGFGLEIIIPLN